MKFEKLKITEAEFDEAAGEKDACYHKVKSRYKVWPSACVALEDSAYGAASAFSAGAITIGIPLHVGIPHSSVHAMWSSLEGKSLEDLQTLWHSHRARESS